MKWLLLIVLIAVLAAGGYCYLNFYQPVRVTNNDVYLTRYASVVTARGVDGFPPGTKFTIDPSKRPKPGQIFVTDGVHQLSVAPDALTRNPDRAREAAAEDAQTQAQAVAGATAAKAHVARVESEAQLNRARDIEQLNARQRNLPPSTKLPPTVAPPPRPPPAPVH